MINLREVEDTIRDLENGSATYNNCMKLASLYIIRDEMKKKEGQYYNYTYRPMMYDNRGMNNPSSSYGYREPMMYTDHSDEMLHGAEEHRR